MKKTILLCFALTLFTLLQAKQIKVACVGNSVTYGAGLENRDTECYPSQLQRLLGDKYVVGNFGKSGATLLNKGHRPYTQQPEFKAALDFAADIVVIHLGLNDTDPRNWPNYRDEFIADYMQLIDSFRHVSPKCKIFICRLTPIAHRHARFKSGTRDWYWQIQEYIERIAAHSDVTLIDLQEGLYPRPDLLPDALHPNAEGAGIIASTIGKAITGNFGGLQLPMLYTDNMVLQRNKPLTLSGTADSGEKVTVSINGVKAETVTRTNGKWSVTLPAMKAGGPYTLTVKAPSRIHSFKNVMIGEVWICSGQSNMAFMLKQAATGKQTLKNIESDKKGAPVRFFNMQARWNTTATSWDAAVMDSLNRLEYYQPAKWEECSASTAPNMSAVAYYFGRMLADSLNVPVGLIHNAVGGSPAEAWIDRKTLELMFPDILYNWTTNDMIQEWARGRALLNIKNATNKLQRHPYEPCYLYESGIAPLQAYPVQGTIWYQGESNAHNTELHETLFPLLVESWRKVWGEKMPFYFVQLSSLNRPSWPLFRDSQRRLSQQVPLTAMAVCSDLGDSLDVHPTRKKEVGERLARLALNKTYGKSIIPCGPMIRSAKAIGSTAELTFDYGTGMRGSDGKPVRTFEVAGDDARYYPARAVINKGKVRVQSDQVKKPRFVRYAWQPFTRANLVNGAGLPASTFNIEINDSQK